VTLLIPWFLFWGWSYYRAYQNTEEAWNVRCAVTSICDRTNPLGLELAEPNVRAWKDQQARALWIGGVGPIALSLLLAGGFWVWRGYRSADEEEAR
jgi:hypothetical protein